MNGADRLDPVLGPVPLWPHGVRVGAAAPVGFQGHNVQAEADRHLFPQMGKLTGAADQDTVARDQGVGQR